MSDELKVDLAKIAEKHIQTEECTSLGFEQNRGDAFKLIFEYSINKNYRVEGYNLKKLVENPQVHWSEIQDLLFDMNETPGLADKGFRDLIHYWFNDLCSQSQS